MTRITRFLLLITAISALVACGVQEPRQPTSSAVIDRALSATIVLYDKNSRLICAGERVSPTLVITAWHCALDGLADDETADLLDLLDPNLESSLARSYPLVSKTMKYSSYAEVLASSNEDGSKNTVQTHTGMLVVADPVLDIAILKTPLSGDAVVPFRKRQLNVGEEVFAIGHPLGLKFSFAHGYVSNDCRRNMTIDEGQCWVQADITIHPGNSGGGLYDADGFLVGIASAGLVRGGVGWYAPPSAIETALKAADAYRAPTACSDSSCPMPQH